MLVLAFPESIVDHRLESLKQVKLDTAIVTQARDILTPSRRSDVSYTVFVLRFHVISMVRTTIIIEQ